MQSPLPSANNVAKRTFYTCVSASNTPSQRTLKRGAVAGARPQTAVSSRASTVALNIIAAKANLLPRLRAQPTLSRLPTVLLSGGTCTPRHPQPSRKSNSSPRYSPFTTKHRSTTTTTTIMTHKPQIHHGTPSSILTPPSPAPR